MKRRWHLPGKKPGTHLWLYPSGGLCNRMRVLDSAIYYARANRCRVDVIWQLKDELNCRFDILFEPLPVFRRFYNFSHLNRRGQQLDKTYRKLMVVPWTDSIILPFEHQEMDRENGSTESLLNGHATCLETWMRFYKMGKPFADFKPVSRLQKIIDEQTAQFSRTVGVHIRRTDNVVAIKHSPTRNFIDAMDREIAQNSESTFFVSTDSPEEEAVLREKFPRRILSYRKRTLKRNSPEGIEDAVIDLYCLARTSKILGSYLSSFTTAAGEIGGVETVWMHQQA